jgi:hypothetical protein
VFRLRLLASPLSISPFTIAGWASWLAQDTHSAVACSHDLGIPFMNFTSPSTLR